MAQITLNSSGVASSGSLLLQTNGTTTQATVDTSGNLGLGVTPSSWDSTYKALQVGSRSMFYGIGSEANMANNAYYNAGYKYVASSAAGLYTIDANVHKWYNAASGTAGNAISFTQAMTLDASGNLGIGTTSPSAKLHVNNGFLQVDISGTQAVRVGSSDSILGGTDNNAVIQANTSKATIFLAGGSERARIDSSGNLLVGTTSSYSGNYRMSVACASGTGGISLRAVNTSTNYPLGFQNSSGTDVGSVTITTTATAYNTSSDYRLKHDIHPMTGALAKVAALKPCTYKWNADNSEGEGFIAHELAQVCPHAVTGAKDAVDEHGNPQYQGIDTSFLVATLTAALQEAHGLIKDLQTRVAELES